MSKKPKKYKNVYFISIIIFLFCAFSFNFFNISVNFTSSMPYGFYIKSKNTKIKQGDYISLCLDKDKTIVGLKYNYLEPGKACNGSMPLIKQVIALPYQSVYLSESNIFVSGKKINAPTSFFDSQHRKLEIYPRGLYKGNCYWVLGDYNVVNSWDSRYWGCIQQKQIISKIIPLITW